MVLCISPIKEVSRLPVIVLFLKTEPYHSSTYLYTTFPKKFICIVTVYKLGSWHLPEPF